MDTANFSASARCTQTGNGSSLANEPQFQGCTLRIRCKGMQINIEDIAEIKSRSIRSDLGSDVWQPLWLSDVTKLFLGKHYYRGFLERNVGLSDESEAILGWEEKNVDQIRRFHRVLEEVFHLSLTLVSSGESKGKLLALVFEGSGKYLALHRRTEDSHVLPGSLEVDLRQISQALTAERKEIHGRKSIARTVATAPNSFQGVSRLSGLSTPLC